MNRKLLLVLLFLFFKAAVFAQPFGANNASWYFTKNTIFPPSHNFLHATGSAPFLFNGDTCYRISTGHIGGCWIDTSFIVKQSNDSVYYYLPATNHFVMLYNYNAMVGDTQRIYGRDISSGDTSVLMVVTATGMITINGIPKRVYTIVPATSNYYFDFWGNVIEDIGNTSFLFPQWDFCDPTIQNIRCYEDSVNGFTDWDTSLPCDTIIWLGMDQHDIDRNIIVTPNPFTSEISIAINGQELQKASFSIKNTFGQTLYESAENNSVNTYTKTIDLNFLSSGVYFLILNVDKEQVVRIIVKS